MSQTFIEQVRNYIRAGYPALYLVTHEETRGLRDLQEVAKQTKLSIRIWSCTEGLGDPENGTTEDIRDPYALLQSLGGLSETLIVLRDLHLFPIETDPLLNRGVRETILAGKRRGNVICFLSPRQVLPPEWEKLIVIVPYALPDRQTLGVVLDGVIESAKESGVSAKALKLKAEERDAVIESAKGLTTDESESAFALSLAETGRLDPAVIAREKAVGIAKGGLLEFLPPAEGLESVGGLGNLKKWLERRRLAFSQKARAFGLPAPRGLLMVGCPGTGKSLVSKAVAKTWGLPTLRLDMGKMMGSLVGQSEEQLRRALAIAEATAPVLLVMDEIEKGLSGGASSGVSDGGTTARVLGTFLSWMQEKTAPVMILATANDVSRLPPELLRKGRFDEIFTLDLPNQEDRVEILKIHIAKRGRDPKKFPLTVLADLTDGFNGSELEEAVISGLYEAFYAGRDLSEKDLATAIKETVPLSVTMAEKVEAIREWGRARARPAAGPVRQTGGLRKVQLN
ncbi:MAG: AAA family ATPase [Planctomycetota bacterium]|nr:AAA family ATPase [Planctomycetota bacterium]